MLKRLGLLGSLSCSISVYKKCFITITLGANVRKVFSSLLMKRTNKLEPLWLDLMRTGKVIMSMLFRGVPERLQSYSQISDYA
jgi:hypothetical protein